MATHDLLAALTAAPLGAAMAVAAGAVLGGVFYAGLWWTVRRAASFRHPGPSVLASLLLRMAITLGGFYLVADGDWLRLLFCLLGFMVARAAVTWLTCLPPSTRVAHRARHAP
jgi:F1F0 ATPase subunit 2